MREIIIENRIEIIKIYLIIYAIMSLITFIFYLADKIKARNGSWRIPEATLLTLPWFLGSLGGILGMYVVRHKTKAEHWYFAVDNILALIIHTGLLIGLFII